MKNITHINKQKSFSVEEIDTGVYYKGKGKILNGRFVVIHLPSNADKVATDFKIDITPIYSTTMCDFVYIQERKDDSRYCNLYPSDVVNNSFIVYGPNADFFWIATGKPRSIEVETNNDNKSEII